MIETEHKKSLELDNHYLIDHLNIKLVCTVCNIAFESIKFLWDHQRISHKESYKKCHLCSKSCNKLYNLKRHLIGKHLQIKKTCPLCGSKICSAFFNKHLKFHSMSEQEKEVFRASRASRAYRASRAHKQIKCDKCDKTFTSRGALFYHKKKNCSTRLYKKRKYCIYSKSSRGF